MKIGNRVKAKNLGSATHHKFSYDRQMDEDEEGLIIDIDCDRNGEIFILIIADRDGAKPPILIFIVN